MSENSNSIFMRTSSILFSTMTLMSSVAVAGYLPPPQVVCAEDRQKYCSKVEPGYARVEACLRANINKVLPACKTYLENKAAARKAAGKENEPEPAAE